MTALAAHALTTLDEACDAIGIDVGDDDDAVIKTINRASKRIASFLRGAGGALHYEAGIVEDVAGFGTVDLMLSRTPIWSVASITVDGAPIAAGDYSIGDKDAGALFAPCGWDWTTRRGAGVSRAPIVGAEEKLFQVTYTAGWWTKAQGPEGDAPAGVELLPDDIEDALLDFITTLYARRGSGADAKSESLMSYSVTYRDDDSGDADNQGLPGRVAAALAGYKFLQQST